MDPFLESAIEEAAKSLSDDGIPHVLIGGNPTFKGAEDSLLAAGVEVERAH